MKRPFATTLAFLAVVLVSGTNSVQANEQSAPLRETVRVTWIRPGRVPAKQRPALTRLLVAAVEGPASALATRDSRPVAHPAPVCEHALPVTVSIRHKPRRR